MSDAEAERRDEDETGETDEANEPDNGTGSAADEASERSEAAEADEPDATAPMVRRIGNEDREAGDYVTQAQREFTRVQQLPEQERDLPTEVESHGSEVPDVAPPEPHDPERFPRRPTSILDNPERIQSRSYDRYWARFPLDEVDQTTGPGAGPYGSVGTADTNWAVVTIWLGLAAIALNFFVQHPIVLGLGALLIVVGAVWTMFWRTHPGSFKGVGTSKVKARNLKKQY
ncbi:hypothetical protein ER308_12750 [Egibacter rhizosphaerae]|uniref:Uncharacterized protein n=1 Tax=Egibacter rhizosphaerae TaxID=1670831 RepID=A0A411YGK4_9ACTN|nr:hypothetical protein [Egibacter rhizosphaerae]QBI20348.1 hypothetical protein ER308_12750 [Egibacter rhizosphaerae]